MLDEDARRRILSKFEAGELTQPTGAKATPSDDSSAEAAFENALAGLRRASTDGHWEPVESCLEVLREKARAVRPITIVADYGDETPLQADRKA